MARACDRCSRLKTQCNGDRPCNRCERLDLDCTQTRPVLAKGRPKRDSNDVRPKRVPNSSHNATSQSASPQRTATDILAYPPPTEASLELVRCLPELPIPEPIAAYLLDLAFSPMSNVGVLEVFSTIDVALSLHSGAGPAPAKRTKLSSAAPTNSKALLYTIMVFSATLCSPRDSSLNLPALQQCALNSVPALYGNSRDLRIEDALSLCYLSYLGCLNGATIKAAEIWAGIAVMVARQALEDDEECDSSPFHEKAQWLVCINDRIFSLLHYRQPFAKQLKFYKPTDLSRSQSASSGVLDKMSIVGVLQQPTSTPKSYNRSDYFSLYLPLLRPLDLALEEPQSNSVAWEQAVLELERYYSEFPLDLMAYNDIKQVYQAEAMVWFHGIFLLLGGSRDLYNYFDNKSWFTSPSFLRCTEHALLLGEAIPALARLMKSNTELSPATVYFLLLSSVIHAVVLRLFIPSKESSSAFTPQTDGEKSSWSKLIESTHLHLFILRRIREDSITCTIDLVYTIESILQPIYTAATSGRYHLDADFSVLKMYRWTGRGRGIVKVNSKIAEELSRLSVTSASNYSSPNGMDGETARRKILAVYDPRTRQSRPGHFCRSI